MSLQEVVTGSLENPFFQYWFHDLLGPMNEVAPRQGSLHWAGLYKVVPCRTGSCMVTPTPVPEPLLVWMVEDGFEAAREFVGMQALELLPRVAEVMDAHQHVGRRQGRPAAVRGGAGPPHRLR